MLTATLGFTGDYALDNWTADTIPHGTTAISPASGDSSEATFSFAPTSSPGSDDELLVDFLTTATDTGTVTFDYEYAVNAPSTLAGVPFEAVSGNGATRLVDFGFFGTLTFRGSASIISQQGQDLGFRIGDANDNVSGDLRIFNIAFHDTLVEPIVVSSAGDGDDGDLSPGNLTLREAVRLANEVDGTDTITFDPSLAGSTITLTEGQLEITSSVTINGLGADQLTVSGGGVSRVFAETQVGGEQIITITDLTIANGLGQSGGAFQGNGSDVTFERVVMTGNNSIGNNGSTIVMAFGTLEIIDSAIVDNLNRGVGALRLQDSQSTITNTTISGNGTRGISVFNTNTELDTLTLNSVTIADNAGEGIEAVNFNGPMQLEYQNTIIAGNGNQLSIDARTNEAGLPLLSIVSLGHNLLDDTPTGDAAHAAATGDLRNTDPLLLPLADNGGPTPTHALAEDSPAIDAGNSLLAVDQRGLARAADLALVPNAAGSNASDIGAFEAYGLSAFPGDYNLDGRVDAADYSVWRDQRDTTGLAPFSGADGTGDGQVDQADRDLWVTNYGRTTPIDSRVTPPQAEFAPAAVVATPAPSEPAAEPTPAPAVDAAPFTNATAAAVDSAIAAFGAPKPRPSLTPSIRTIAQAAFAQVDDQELLLHLLSSADAEAVETDSDAGPQRSEEPGSSEDEPQSTASVGGFFGGVS